MEEKRRERKEIEGKGKCIRIAFFPLICRRELPEDQSHLQLQLPCDTHMLPCKAFCSERRQEGKKKEGGGR